MPDETAPIDLVLFTSDDSVQWTGREQETIRQAALDVAAALAREVNRKLEAVMGVMDRVDPGGRAGRRRRVRPVTPEETFLKTYGDPVTFRRVSKTASQFFDREDGAWGFTQSRKLIFIFKNAPAFRDPPFGSVSTRPQFSVHELGHAFENAVAKGIGHKRGRNSLTRDLYDNRAGFAQKTGFQQSRTFGSDQSGRGEIFADMYIGWVYEEWETIGGMLTAEGLARKNFMDRMMLGLIEDAMRVGDGA